MDRRSARGNATRQSIIEVATELFAARGYDAVSIEAILARSEVSRGALYHHFASKDVVFEAVLEAAEARIAAEVSEAARQAASPAEALRSGCLAWLALAANDAAIRQIVLQDAPTVLGWRKWREIDARHGLGLVRQALLALSDAAPPDARRLDIEAQALLALMVELALLVATSTSDFAGTLARCERVLDVLLGGFIELRQQPIEGND